ncbi:MAG TPA: YlbF family regulator [Gemmatimonadales bacterium]|nr:YlbF family regulator [Gemmatimonadales bacterium]
MLDDKALDLGRQIGQSPEYQALRRAETALRADQDAVSQLEKIQDLARQVDAAISRGELPDEATTQQYETSVRELEMSSAGQAYVVARSNFDKLMARINHQISQGIEKGATSSIITL